MPATEAQIRANQANAAKSTGPTTPEGKLASSGNALTHGLTAVKLVPELEAAEVERRGDAFVAELKPTGSVGEALARHAARMSVRMERCGELENALMLESAREALAEFVPPEGASPAEIAGLRREVEGRALMAPSKATTLARKYELAAERGFFRALQELRIHEKRAKQAEAGRVGEESGSFSPGAMGAQEFDALYPEPTPPPARGHASTAGSVDFAASLGRVDVPFTIGRRR